MLRVGMVCVSVYMVRVSVWFVVQYDPRVGMVRVSVWFVHVPILYGSQ